MSQARLQRTLEQQKAWCSVKALAKLSGYSRRYVQQALMCLIEKGAIERRQSKGFVLEVHPQAYLYRSRHLQQSLKRSLERIEMAQIVDLTGQQLRRLPLRKA